MNICVQRGKTTVWLARGLEFRELPSNLQWSRQPAAQVEDLLRAATPATFNRGNVRRTIKFSVDREHDSLHAANRFALDHDKELAALETEATGITVIFTTEGPGQSGQVSLLDCIVVADTAVFGVGSTTTYTITGGELQ